MKLLLPLLAALAFAPAVFSATRSVPSQYSTIQAAVNAAGSGDTINIANGTYNEVVNIPSSKTNIRLIGASQTGVKIQSGQNQTTITVNGTDITFSTMSIINTYLSGSTTSHAVRVNSKRVQFNRCYINGWQDTLALWNDSLSYFSYCEIRGSVDYIYSGGTAFFQSTNIRQCRNTGGVDCAPSTPQNVTYGFVFNACTITRSSGVPNNSLQRLHHHPQQRRAQQQLHPHASVVSLRSHRLHQLHDGRPHHRRRLVGVGWAREHLPRGGIRQQDPLGCHDQSLRPRSLGEAPHLRRGRDVYALQRARRLGAATLSSPAVIRRGTPTEASLFLIG
jgi:pectin methylesterase-like acyl-CoA thioesterase